MPAVIPADAPDVLNNKNDHVATWKVSPSSNLFIYLFIYCHLYSAFSIVQCSNALYRL